MMYFTLCNPPQTIWNLAKPHFLGRFHHKGKHSFENVAKGVSLILKQGHSIASFQHGVRESIYESFVKVAVNFGSSTPKVLLTKPIPVIRNSYPLLSDSSIRRLERQSRSEEH